jgi:glycosyltransferase involved in cell wall biosynthesis
MQESIPPRSSSQLRLAAFIMTYERPEIITSTIQSILHQTHPPEKIIVIDNSESTTTELLIKKLAIKEVQYHRVGYNAGPAGAAKIGLEILAKEEFEWIYWGDDDDPPEDVNSFERLLNIGLKTENAGAVGSIGGLLNKFSGQTRNLRNSELQEINEVDYIPGNKNFLINTAVVKQNVFPSPELFFGFEELDFCLKMKRAGFRIYIDGASILKGRMAGGKTDPEYRWKGKQWGAHLPGPRQYYSARNILFVLIKHKMPVAFFYMLIKTALKSFLGFKYGAAYGKQAFRIYTSAIIDFLLGKTGRKIFT